MSGGYTNEEATELAGLIAWLEGLANEYAIGYDDSGCMYRIVVGNRGAGSMIRGIGETFTSEPGNLLDALREYRGQKKS